MVNLLLVFAKTQSVTKDVYRGANQKIKGAQCRIYGAECPLWEEERKGSRRLFAEPLLEIGHPVAAYKDFLRSCRGKFEL
jgi:hypothetical protein